MEDLNKKNKKELLEIINKRRQPHHISNCNISVNVNELSEEIKILDNLSSAINNLSELLLAKKTRPVYGIYIESDK